MADKRKSISKRTRFDVFKRDKFTCQYCGAKAPDVVLQVDHVHPVAEGGTDDILNLITSCAGCNGGKGARPISDDSAVSRQRDQLAKLEERRQQIEMMIQWRQEVATQGEALVEAVSKAWSAALKGWGLNEVGRAKVAAFIKKHGFDIVMDAIDSVRERFPQAATVVLEAPAADAAFKHLTSLLKYGGDPDGQQMAYVIGILRNRCSGRQTVFHADMRGWHQRGVSIDHMTSVAKTVRSWAQFIEAMEGAAQ
jgi:hypothetical protein